MLRDEVEGRLNELLVALKDASLRYDEAARLAVDEVLAAGLAALARERARQSRELSARILARGDLPDGADADREALASLLTRVKVVFAGERTALAHEVAAGEQRLAQLAAEALTVAAEADTRAFLERVRQESERAAAAFPAR